MDVEAVIRANLLGQDISAEVERRAPEFQRLLLVTLGVAPDAELYADKDAVGYGVSLGALTTMAVLAERGLLVVDGAKVAGEEKAGEGL